MTSHLGAIMRDELRKVLDARLSELGFDADEKGPELLEPKSKFQALTENLEKRLQKVEEQLKE